MSGMQRHPPLAALLWLVVTAAPVYADGPGAYRPPPRPAPPPVLSEQSAIDAYNIGYAAIQRADHQQHCSRSRMGVDRNDDRGRGHEHGEGGTAPEAVGDPAEGEIARQRAELHRHHPLRRFRQRQAGASLRPVPGGAGASRGGAPGSGGKEGAGLPSLDQLYRKYSPSLYWVCMKYVRNKEDAEDMVNQVFVKVQQNLSGFKGQSGIYTWMYRIAVNECIQMFRRRKFEADPDSLPDFEAALPTFPEHEMDAPALETPQLHEHLGDLARVVLGVTERCDSGEPQNPR